MAGKGLQQYALEHNLTLLKDKAFGFYRNYQVTVGETGNKGTRYYTAVFAEKDQEHLQSLMNALERVREIKGVQKVIPTYSGVTVTYGEGAGRCDITSFVGDGIVNVLSEMNIKGAGYCPACGERMECGAQAEIFGNVYTMHENCLEEIERANENEKIQAENKGSVLFGAIGAFLGALVGMLPWMLVDLAGYFSAWLGILAATCSKFGYDLFKGKNTVAKSIAVAVSTVIAVIIESFFSYTVLIVNDFSCSFAEAVELNILNLLYNSEYLGNVVLNLILALVFAVIGVVIVVQKINSELPGNKGKVKRL